MLKQTQHRKKDRLLIKPNRQKKIKKSSKKVQRHKSIKSPVQDGSYAYQQTRNFYQTSKPVQSQVGHSFHQRQHSVYNQQRRGYYQVPYYLGLKHAFERQLSSFVSERSPTPLTLSHFLNMPVNHLDLAIHSKFKEQHQENQRDLLQKGSQQPILTVSKLNEQLYSEVYEQALIDNAIWLWTELPTRIAHIIHQIDRLPYGLSNTKQIQLVKNWYELSFRDIVTHTPPNTMQEQRNFSRVLNSILQRHKNIVPVVSQALLYHREIIFEATGGQPCTFLKSFLDNLYSNRIAIRMLISQHIAYQRPIWGYCGLIDLELDPILTIRSAVDDALSLTERTYGVTPETTIVYSHHNTKVVFDKTFQELTEFNPKFRQEQRELLQSKIKSKMENISYYYEYKSEPNSIAFIDGHLHHMVFELIKNSSRATVEEHNHLFKSSRRSNHNLGGPIITDQLPPITIAVGSGAEDLTIKISDFGGGIPAENESKLFSYLHTTAGPLAQDILKRFDVAATMSSEMQMDANYTTTTIQSKTPLLSITASSIITPTESMLLNGGNDAGGGDLIRDGIMKASGGGGGNASSGDVFLSPNNQHIPGNIGQPESSDSSFSDGIIDSQATAMSNVVPLAGFGVGLAMSRLFARFADGELSLSTVDGLGTDTVLSLKKLTPHTSHHQL